MNRFLYVAILILVFCASCTDTKKEKLSNLINEWLGKEIYFPMDFMSEKLDSNITYCDSLNHAYSIFCYIDSMGCMSCKLKLPEWKSFMSIVDSLYPNTVSFRFVFQSPKIRELELMLKRENFSAPILIDKKGVFEKMNNFPSDMSFQTFLLDEDNKVVAIGNPVHNPKVKELYLKIIQEGKVEQGNKTEVINTKVAIDKTSISLGRFNWQKEQKVTFTLKNTGNKPLVVQDVNTSCGCTSVSYSKEPVQPSGELKLEVTYKAEHPEHFNKTLTVYCNTESSPLILKIMRDAE